MAADKKAIATGAVLDFSQTAGAGNDFLVPDEILGVPFTCTAIEIANGPNGEFAILTVGFDGDPENYQIANGGAYFLRQAQRIRHAEQVPFRACLERNENGRKGPNGKHPLVMMDVRSKRGGKDMEWVQPDTDK